MSQHVPVCSLPSFRMLITLEVLYIIMACQVVTYRFISTSVSMLGDYYKNVKTNQDSVGELYFVYVLFQVSEDEFKI